MLVTFKCSLNIQMTQMVFYGIIGSFFIASMKPGWCALRPTWSCRSITWQSSSTKLWTAVPLTKARVGPLIAGATRFPATRHPQIVHPHTVLLLSVGCGLADLPARESQFQGTIGTGPRTGDCGRHSVGTRSCPETC